MFVVHLQLRRRQTPLPNTLHIMNKYATNSQLLQNIMTTSEDFGITDTDVVSITVTSRDLSLHFKTSETSMAFQVECTKQFMLTLTGTTHHITDGILFVTNSWECKTHRGPVKIDFTLSGESR